MAVLGKRKASEGPSISEEEAAAIFQRHFEAQFSPLPGATAKATEASPTDDATGDDESESSAEESEDDKEDNDEWGGLSEEEPDEEEDKALTVVEVVDHSRAQPPKPSSMSKRELKAFMSSRPPDQTSLNATPSTTSSSPASSSTLPEDAPSLLAQDLELRRLLAESHLLAPSRSSTNNTITPKTFAAGRTRQKATDLRVQALGAKISIHKQEKMPMNMRKGMVASANARETKRRREAKENGIILEKETGQKSKRSRGRDLGVDRPGVGRLRGSELRLNDRDVRSIENGRDAFGRKGRR
ncbi:hypothetical protein B0T10DRAFT_488523 [Thelonectria olida]|uniref:Protein FAF1 n=1 Tax=Thelonectria olida TaxID=1576542 RepID=A0A9P9ANU9_9HYPO|nr:hypothetical protein B0T10DRAFT_488523 [Thelonectria olida]